jgi:cellulase/cellobiase CelA1
MMDISSAYWIDVKSKVVGTGTGTLEGILQDAASKPIKQLVTFMIYDLPNRDCHAKASNGEICCTYNTDGTCNYLAGGDCSAGLREYKDEYIDPIYDVLMAYQHMVEIVLIIEPDSLPNLATNLADPQCGNSATNAAYTEGIAYTIRKFSDLRMTMYLDAGHGGWLGWVDNMRLFVDVVLSMDFPIQALRGAYSPLYTHHTHSPPYNTLYTQHPTPYILHSTPYTPTLYSPYRFRDKCGQLSTYRHPMSLPTLG